MMPYTVMTQNFDATYGHATCSVANADAQQEKVMLLQPDSGLYRMPLMRGAPTRLTDRHYNHLSSKCYTLALVVHKVVTSFEAFCYKAKILNGFLA